MTAPDLPHVQYAVQANGDVTTLLSWLGVDTASEQNDNSNAGGYGDPNQNDNSGGYGDPNQNQNVAPPVDQMPHLQLALQSNGDLNHVLNQFGIDPSSEQAESESESY